jgi:hypothetical protein
MEYKAVRFNLASGNNRQEWSWSIFLPDGKRKDGRVAAGKEFALLAVKLTIDGWLRENARPLGGEGVTRKARSRTQPASTG